MPSCEIILVNNCRLKRLPIIRENPAGQLVCQSCKHKHGRRGEIALVEITGAMSSGLGTVVDPNAGGLTVSCRFDGCRNHVEGASVGEKPPDLRPWQKRAEEARKRW